MNIVSGMGIIVKVHGKGKFTWEESCRSVSSVWLKEGDSQSPGESFSGRDHIIVAIGEILRWVVFLKINL